MVVNFFYKNKELFSFIFFNFQKIKTLQFYVEVNLF